MPVSSNSQSVDADRSTGAAVDLLLEIGPAAVEQRVMEVTDQLAEGLRCRDAEIISPWGVASGIAVFRRASENDPQPLVDRLNAANIIVRARGGGVQRRTSPTIKTTRAPVRGSRSS
jgi:selenocysteine lyase/cysteine desulfurase